MRYIKIRKVCIVLCMIILITVLSTAGYKNDVYASDSELAIALESGYHKEDNRLEVNVVVKNNPGIAALVLQLYYDSSELTLISAEAGDIFKEPIINDTLTDEIDYVYAMAADTSDTGNILKLTFTCSDSVTHNKALVAVRSADAANFNERNVDVVSGGKLNVILDEQNNTSDSSQQETIYIQDTSVQHVTPYIIITDNQNNRSGEDAGIQITQSNEEYIGDGSSNTGSSTDSSITDDNQDKNNVSHDGRTIDTLSDNNTETDNQLKSVSHNNHKGVIIITCIIVVVILVAVILFLNKSKINIRRKKNEK